jgi:hypothetical protein
MWARCAIKVCLLSLSPTLQEQHARIGVETVCAPKSRRVRFQLAAEIDAYLERRFEDRLFDLDVRRLHFVLPGVDVFPIALDTGAMLFGVANAGDVRGQARLMSNVDHRAVTLDAGPIAPAFGRQNVLVLVFRFGDAWRRDKAQAKGQNGFSAHCPHSHSAAPQRRLVGLSGRASGQAEGDDLHVRFLPYHDSRVTWFHPRIYRWRKEFGELRLSQAQRLKGLERENELLRRLVANLSLANGQLKDQARKDT